MRNSLSLFATALMLAALFTADAAEAAEKPLPLAAPETFGISREQLAKTLPKEHFEPRKHQDEQDERNLFDRVKDMFG